MRIKIEVSANNYGTLTREIEILAKDYPRANEIVTHIIQSAGEAEQQVQTEYKYGINPECPPPPPHSPIYPQLSE
jgi:hypothetical protein